MLITDEKLTFICDKCFILSEQSSGAIQNVGMIPVLMQLII